MKRFVKLTFYESGLPLHVNSERVSVIYEYREYPGLKPLCWIRIDGWNCSVNESPEEVLRLLVEGE